MANLLRPEEQDWIDVFERLTERFPTVSQEKIVQVLRESEGHAGNAARLLRDMTTVNVKAADPDDAEHVSMLLSSPAIFNHTCKEHFKKHDVNADGVLEFKEILAVTSDLYSSFGLEPPSEGNLWGFFKANDENNDGVLSEKEFRKFFEMLLRYAFFDVAKYKQMVEQGVSKGGNTPPSGSRDSSTRVVAAAPQSAAGTQRSARESHRHSSRGRHRDSVERAREVDKENVQQRSAPGTAEKPEKAEKPLAPVSTMLRCVAPNGVAFRSSPNFDDRTENVVARGQKVKVHEIWIRTSDGWLPMVDAQGQALFAQAGSAEDRTQSQDRRVRILEEGRGAVTPASKMQAEKEKMAASGYSAGNSEPPRAQRSVEIPQEWQERFQRLHERFPTASKDMVCEALLENDGHAGQTAAALRDAL